MNPPEFETLDSEAIPSLNEEDLGAALRHALLSLHEGGGDSLEGALDLCDAADVARVRDALWTVHLCMAQASMPSEDPYGDAETSELQEACAALIAQACKGMTFDLPFALSALGGETAISMITVIEDWETRYQPEDPDL